MEFKKKTGCGETGKCVLMYAIVGWVSCSTIKKMETTEGLYKQEIKAGLEVSIGQCLQLG